MDASYDPETGIITMISAGFLSPEDVQERAEAISGLIRRSRREQGHVRILSLALDLPTQSTKTVEAAFVAMNKGDTLGDPRDKLAIVISSALARMQISRLMTAGNKKCFGSVDAAKSWLISD